MAVQYSVDICNKIKGQFEQLALSRPFRLDRYEPGDELSFHIEAVADKTSATINIKIEKFVGGGFAGQVYKVKLNTIDGHIDGLEAGKSYAIKILIPPSAFSKLFQAYAWQARGLRRHADNRAEENERALR